MAFQLAIGCDDNGNHKTCCPCCPGTVEVVISGITNNCPIVCSGDSEADFYNGTYQGECPDVIQNNCGSGSTETHQLVINIGKSTVTVSMFSNLDDRPPGEVIQATQARTVVFEFSECPEDGEVGNVISDTFRATYFYRLRTIVAVCTPSGPTTTTTTCGSITKTVITQRTCVGTEQFDATTIETVGDTADLAGCTPSFANCADNYTWLSNMVNAVISATWSI